jgi:hypothetical protein
MEYSIDLLNLEEIACVPPFQYSAYSISFFPFLNVRKQYAAKQDHNDGNLFK